MKTLYISDLDGTLLNRQAELSDYSTTVLNDLIDQGLHFSVATARTAATVVQLMDQVAINVPIVLMNGVTVYDLAAGKYVKVNYIAPTAVDYLLEILKQYQLTGFLYKISQGEMTTYYERTKSEYVRRFVEERMKKFKKKFIQIDDFALQSSDDVVYFSICDREERLRGFYESLSLNKQLHIEFYRDIYEEEYWYLEVCSCNASKYHAVQFLRKEYGFEKVVCFGDNFNDLPMFSASDRSYAVANAKAEVKHKAGAMIESNEADGVVKQLQMLWNG